jgi:hypothetical protein
MLENTQAIDETAATRRTSAFLDLRAVRATSAERTTLAERERQAETQSVPACSSTSGSKRQLRRWSVAELIARSMVARDS